MELPPPSDKELEGLLVIHASKGEKVLAETVYVRAISTRHGAVLAVNMSGATSFLGVSESGEIKRLTIE